MPGEIAWPNLGCTVLNNEIAVQQAITMTMTVGVEYVV